MINRCPMPMPQTQKATGRKVAIKRIAMKLGKYTEGANFTALREIKLLQELKHEHIIEVSMLLLFLTFRVALRVLVANVKKNKKNFARLPIPLAVC